MFTKQQMKFLFDYFPIIAFFIAFKITDNDIIFATITAMVAGILQISAYWIKFRRFEKMHIIPLAILLVMGSITVYLGDPLYIKWKVTVVEWVMGLALIASQYIWKVNWIKKAMGQAFDAPDDLWHHINLAWALFFIAVGFLNIYVLYNFSTEDWVNFKLFGLMGLTFGFTLITMLFLFRYVNKDEDDEEKNEQGEQ